MATGGFNGLQSGVGALAKLQAQDQHVWCLGGRLVRRCGGRVGPRVDGEIGIMQQ